jgi:hypothetical protein
MYALITCRCCRVAGMALCRPRGTNPHSGPRVSAANRPRGRVNAPAGLPARPLPGTVRPEGAPSPGRRRGTCAPHRPRPRRHRSQPLQARIPRSDPTPALDELTDSSSASPHLHRFLSLVPMAPSTPPSHPSPCFGPLSHLIASPCRRPASGPPTFCLGCPAGFSCRSRKGGPARSGGPPFLESPGLPRTSGRRRGGGPSASKTNTQRPTPTDRRQEADTSMGCDGPRAVARAVPSTAEVPHHADGLP